jgi:ADP-ribosylglycohydrolase
MLDQTLYINLFEVVWKMFFNKTLFLSVLSWYDVCMQSDTVYDGMYGLAIGDAIGVPAEFNTREELSKNPVTDMTGYGTHYQKPGTWSDDTSLSLCLLDSLASGLNYLDIMDKFRSWEELGMYTPYGKLFDIGMTTDEAIDRYIRDIPVLQCGGTDEYNNGNGSLMRILPIAFFIQTKHITYGQAMEITGDISSLTHAHPRSKLACCIYITIALQLLDGKDLNTALDSGLEKARTLVEGKPEFPHFQRLFSPSFPTTLVKEIHSSGYVIDTLEASLWCLYNTRSYQECILTAVNLGDDTDTTASVAGGLAGIAYHRSGMPKSWIERLASRPLIDGICAKFTAAHCPS